MKKTMLKEAKVNQFHDNFLELMSDENIQLPLREDESYEQTLKELFEYYDQKTSEFLSDKQMKVIRMICETILKMIREYDIDAYETFERLMEIHIFRDNLNIIQDVLPVDGYGRTNINLFRLRYVNENKKYKRKDLFHDPKTEKRYKSRKPYRYNLRDRPSLYLSSTVYCCHKELGSDMSKQKMIGSLFRLNPKSKNSLFIVDIANRPIDFVKKSNKYKKANIGYSENAYLFIYPFIAACSVVVPSKTSDENTIEYKIPNILYQWLSKHYSHQLCGIRYFSCHDSFYSLIDKNNELIFERKSKTSFTKYFINYVFPVGDEFDEQGYCCKLKESFLVSNPKFLKEFATIQEFENEIKRSSLMNVDN